jgi:ParB-like chromosome segregation protein Spo0J
VALTWHRHDLGMSFAKTLVTPSRPILIALALPKDRVEKLAEAA